jgi:hypothetical protein
LVTCLGDLTLQVVAKLLSMDLVAYDERAAAVREPMPRLRRIQILQRVWPRASLMTSS